MATAQITTTETVSRRHLVAIAAALSVATPQLATAAPAGNLLDAALLATFARWADITGRIDTLPGDSDENPEIEAAIEASDVLAVEIQAMPAQTAEGLAAKIYVMAHHQYGTPAGKPSTAVQFPDSGPGRADDGLVSLFRDALRIMPRLAVLNGEG